MQPICIDDPCVLFALSRERGPFCREFRPSQAFGGGPCGAWFCGPAWLSVLAVETGMGSANVAAALDWLLAGPRFGGVPYQPSLLIFAGFAGALTDSLRVGDIVLADEIVDAQGNRWQPTWPAPLADGPWNPPLHRGRLVSVNRMAASVEEKRRLGSAHQAIAVEMESAIFAERCTRAGLPFACLRAISDEVGTPLSPHWRRCSPADRRPPRA